jgi:hypothetical protein
VRQRCQYKSTSNTGIDLDSSSIVDNHNSPTQHGDHFSNFYDRGHDGQQ